MASEYTMQFPFTTEKEIFDWETRYLKNLSKKSRDREEVVIDLKEKVETRKTPETPKGYLSQPELRQMARCKDRFVPSKIDKTHRGLLKRLPAGRSISMTIGKNQKAQRNIRCGGVRCVCDPTPL